MLSGIVYGRLMGVDLAEPSISVREICATVAAQTGVTVREIKSQFVDHRIIRARHVAMMLARHHPFSAARSYPEIARGFDRDHSTIVAVVRGKLADVAEAVLARALPDDKLTKWVDIALEEHDRIMGPKLEATKRIWRRSLAERNLARANALAIKLDGAG